MPPLPSDLPLPPQAQLPAGAAIFLDHVGHFVADRTAASRALLQAGFTPTPVSVQVNPDPDGGAPKPTGTGNVCVMFPRGYVEVLFATAVSPLSRQLDAARSRYDGLHLVTFSVADAEAHRVRLLGAGFPVQPLIRMERPVDTATGHGVAGFDIVRVEPGVMPEGRAQVLRHLTEDTVWQPRWLSHPNGATALRTLTIVVADLEEAGARFARFAGKAQQKIAGGCRIALDRGELLLLTSDAWRARWPTVTPPSLPFMGECTIEAASLTMLERAMRDGGLSRLPDREGVSVLFPEALGYGIWTFVETSALTRPYGALP